MYYTLLFILFVVYVAALAGSALMAAILPEGPNAKRAFGATLGLMYLGAGASACFAYGVF